MFKQTVADKRKGDKHMNDRALQEVPFNEMHNRSHYSRAEGDDGVFFDDMQGQNKNHLQSYHVGVGNQNHHPHGPTL